jgi:hypothetical protein
LARNRADAVAEDGRHARLRLFEAVEPGLVERALDPVGQRVVDLLEIRAEVDLPALQLCIDRGGLVDHQAADEQGRHDHCDEDDQQRQRRGEIAAFRPALKQPVIQRLEQDRRQRAPQQRRRERRHDHAQSDRNRHQEGDEAPRFQSTPVDHCRVPFVSTGRAGPFESNHSNVKTAPRCTEGRP